MNQTASPYYLTPQGLNKLREEFEKLSQFKKAKLSGDVPSTWESEEVNPDYLAFQEDIALLESKIQEYEAILKNAELITPPAKNKRLEVHLGARVVVELDSGEVSEFEIVGTLEADPSSGKISNESPVGSALLNRKIGDEVTVPSSVSTIYRIKRIAYSVYSGVKAGLRPRRSFKRAF